MRVCSERETGQDSSTTVEADIRGGNASELGDACDDPGKEFSFLVNWRVGPGNSLAGAGVDGQEEQRRLCVVRSVVEGP